MTLESDQPGATAAPLPQAVAIPTEVASVMATTMWLVAQAVPNSPFMMPPMPLGYPTCQPDTNHTWVCMGMSQGDGANPYLYPPYVPPLPQVSSTSVAQLLPPAVMRPTPSQPTTTAAMVRAAHAVHPTPEIGGRRLLPQKVLRSGLGKTS